MPKKKRTIDAPSSPSIPTTLVGTGYAQGAAKKIKKRKSKLQQMLDEANK